MFNKFITEKEEQSIFKALAETVIFLKEQGKEEEAYQIIDDVCRLDKLVKKKTEEYDGNIEELEVTVAKFEGEQLLAILNFAQAEIAKCLN